MHVYKCDRSSCTKVTILNPKDFLARADDATDGAHRKESPEEKTDPVNGDDGKGEVNKASVAVTIVAVGGYVGGGVAGLHCVVIDLVKCRVDPQAT